VSYAIRLPANDVLERAIEDLLTRPRGPTESTPRWSAIANPSLIGSSQRLRPGLGRNRPCRHTDDRRGWLDILGNHGTSAHNRPIADM
jgi:hypothetical protein